jgi:branched-chain amino acid aminotransferase
MAQETANPTTKPLPDWSKLSFSLTETDLIFRATGDKRSEPIWSAGEYLPYGNLSFSPAAAFLSYGVGIFEGLKAQQIEDGRVLLFRPDANGERFGRSAERLTMPAYPVGEFVEACAEVVRRNRRFVPPADCGSLYLRPTQHAVDPQLGLAPCNLFSVHIFASPVGSYFSGAAKPVRLRVIEQGRCAPGGTGYAKAMGNYAGAIWVAAQWKEKGYDDVLYLDARHLKYITETSGSNPFVVLKSGTLVTPPLDSQILPGITRDSTLRIAREIVGMNVEEREISIDEVIEDGVELFCTGTAWTLLSVGQIDHGDTPKKFEQSEVRDELFQVLRGIQTGQRDDPFDWIHEV